MASSAYPPLDSPFIQLIQWSEVLVGDLVWAADWDCWVRVLTWSEVNTALNYWSFACQRMAHDGSFLQLTEVYTAGLAKKALKKVV